MELPFKITFKTKKMRTRNILSAAAIAIAMAIAVPARANDPVSDPSQPANTSKTDEIRAQQLRQRLEEIRAMDKSTLTKAEKKELRKEVKEIKKQARELRGVYISIGALIIIILLLILII